MKVNLRAISIHLVAVAMMIGLWPVMAMAGAPAAKAVAETESYDFGSVLEGNDVVHDFLIKNAGNAPLVIHNVRTG